MFLYRRYLLFVAVAVGTVHCPSLLANEVNIIDLPTTDLLYDPISDMLYATVPSSAGAPRGNSITPINPYTGELGTSVFIMSEPSQLAISDDGSTIYATTEGSNMIRPFSVPTMTAGTAFQHGIADRRVADMEVVPGNADALVIAHKRPLFTPEGVGVVMFVNGALLPRTTLAINNVIEFGESPNTLYGHANEISALDFNSFMVDDSPTGGVFDGGFHVKNLITELELDMEYDNGFMYFTNGQVIDIGGPAASGQFAANGPVEPDSGLQRTFFVDGGAIRAFDQTNFLLIDQLPIPGMQGEPGSLVRFGQDGLAFRTSGNQVILVQGNVVPEPTSLALAALAVVAGAGLGWCRRVHGRRG